MASDHPTVTEIRAEAVAADRRRYSAIMALPEAKGDFRPLAEHLFASTELSTDEVRACLLAAAACPASRVAVADHQDRGPSSPRLMH